ncbi:MAG: hypothetical protein O7E56_13210 [SAR324 cluster bacterium]|nr:hypothetical protein [SAR324 cluster bacterium]
MPLTAVMLLLCWHSAAADVRLLYYPNEQIKIRVNSRINKQGEVVRHGLFQRFHANGRAAVQGSYKNNSPVGTWNWWNEDGHLIRRIRYDGQFQELLSGDQFSSPNTTFKDPSGRKLAEGQLKFDKGHGLWKYWFDDGSPKAEGNFVNGIPDGRWTYFHPNGQIKSIHEFQLGLLHGRFMEGYPNGQEQVKGRHEHGMKVGLWRQWYASGQIRAKGRYFNGQEEGEWGYWREDGALDKRVLYKGGKILGNLPMPRDFTKPEPVIPYTNQQDVFLPRIFDEDGNVIPRKE